LAENFGATFTINSFTDAGGNLWTKTISGGTYYQFSGATGILTVIPEPGTWMLVVSGLLLTLVRHRKRQ